MTAHITKQPSYRAVLDSGLFDADYYRATYSDLAHDPNPLAHYMVHGAFEGRNPNPWFHSKWYTWRYPDVGRNRDNPLLHYLVYGAQEGRDPSPWFNTVEYLLDNPGLAEAGINPLGHYIASGKARYPDPLQTCLLLQNNSDRAVESPALTDLIDFPPRDLNPVNREYNPASLDIHWIAPDFAPGGGGSMTMFRLVRLLEQLGHHCTVWITRPTLNGNARSAGEVATRHYQTVKAEIKFLSSDFFAAVGDALICTSWETVIFGMHATGFKDRFYLVQDYEPSFFATGSHSLAVEWTYSNDIACICASPWLAEKLASTFGRWTRFSWLASDFEIYRPPVQRQSNSIPRIAFYARRYTERRAVDLGLLALEQLAKQGFRFHVEFFGAKLNVHGLPYFFTDNGVLSEAELAKLYHRCDAGMVFSSTNYSLVPQEMMASGLPVLELNAESTRRIYPEGVVTLAGPHPLDIAAKLRRFLEDPEARAKQAGKALEWVGQFTWDQFGRVVEQAILERLAEKAFVPRPPAPAVMSGKPKVSVLIPTFNGGPSFQRVMRRVQSQRTDWPFEVIVVDSESTDGTAEFAEAEATAFCSIPKHEFQHGRTRNLGIEMASGEYVAIITHDALPASDTWLYNMIAVFEKYPRAAGAFGRHLAYPDASPFLKRDIDGHFAGFDSHPMAVSKYTHYKKWISGDIGWRQMLHFFSDNNSCVRKSVWNSIPYPNIEFGEDQVWAMRIVEAGYEKLYVNSAAVFHSHNYSPEELFRQSQQEGRFFKKYFDYDCVPREEGALEEHIRAVNAGDTRWAEQHGVDSAAIASQQTLMTAKLKGLWSGMMSTSYVGYESDPLN